MNHYPLFLNLKDKKAVVFGAGAVALRKIKVLLQSGAHIQVASRDYSREILALAKRHPRLRLRRNTAPAVFLKDADIAFIATSDSAVNKKMARQCRKKKIWVNVVDRPELSDFFVPSYFKRGKLEIAISTGGASPLLARKLREELNEKIRPEAVRFLSRMSRFRRAAFTGLTSQKARRRFLEEKIGKGFHFLSGGKGGNSNRS